MIKLIQKYHKLNQQIEGLLALQEDLKKQMTNALGDKDAMKGEGWNVYKTTRQTVKCPLDTAKLYGAVKEKVDKTKIKNLLAQGIQVEGATIKETEYLTVRIDDDLA